MSALPIGFGMGLLVAAQIGPMSLFLIRSVLRGSLRTGLAIGGGIAVIDTLYAAAGAAPVLSIDSVRVVFGVIGAVVLAVLGGRTLHSAFRVRLGAEADEEVATPRRAFATSLAATASNPLTIASWAAIFSAASAAGATSSFSTAVLLVAGVGFGSALWDVALATGTAVVGQFVGDRFLSVVDLVAGIGLVAFGVVLAASVLA